MYWSHNLHPQLPKTLWHSTRFTKSGICFLQAIMSVNIHAGIIIGQFFIEVKTVLRIGKPLMVRDFLYDSFRHQLSYCSMVYNCPWRALSSVTFSYRKLKVQDILRCLWLSFCESPTLKSRYTTLSSQSKLTFSFLVFLINYAENGYISE